VTKIFGSRPPKIIVPDEAMKMEKTDICDIQILSRGQFFCLKYIFSKFFSNPFFLNFSIPFLLQKKITETLKIEVFQINNKRNKN